MSRESLADLQARSFAVQAAGGSTPQAAQQGRFGIASSGRLSLTAAGNFRLSFQNNGTKTIALVRFTGFCSATTFTDIRINPTTGLPTPQRNSQSAILGGPAPVGVVRADTDTLTPLGGGTLTSLVVALPANNRQVVDLPPLYVPAGVTIGFNINAATSCEGNFSIFWVVGE